MDKINGYELLEQQTAKYLTGQIKDVITRVQRDYGVDVFGFGQYLYRHHYKEFQPVKNEWNSRFAQAEVDVSVNIHIARSELKSKTIERDTSNP
ncbi:hypothetical protein D3C73_1381260 [compost metagenome]